MKQFKSSKNAQGLDIAKVTTDRFGVPTINAHSRLEAFLTLGYLTARDRLFQLDLLRRLTAGRLSEVLGKATVEVDMKQRILGFQRVARKVVLDLPDDQRAILQAYADGVNMFLQNTKILPPEFLALRYTPDFWQPEDSILIGLYIFQNLTEDEEDFERMMTVMEATLPPEVVDFLTPDEDDYIATLIGGQEPHRPSQKIPSEMLSELRQWHKQVANSKVPPIEEMKFVKGSNSWVVGRSKTYDGRAILANDIHLNLSVPNIWYKVSMCYERVRLSGFVMPGFPMMIVGSSQYIAWGYTTMHSDVLDLVMIEVNPENVNEYKTPTGWNPFILIEETIHVKGQADIHVPVKMTIWGPVAQKTLLNQSVAIRWTALDPQAIDIGLLHMDKARTLEDAIRVMNEFGGPPMNVMLVDMNGHIGWTFCGRLPRRKGYNGTSARFWADGCIGWNGYIAPEELPKVIDPPSDFLVTANNRTLGTRYPYIVGYNFVSGYRAYSISQKLQAMDGITERDMFNLQLDNNTSFYDFYRSLALGIITPEIIHIRPELALVRRLIADWNGVVDASSTGFPILHRFREALSKEIFSSYIQDCRNIDDNFVYRWGTMETPLRSLLQEKIPETLPYPAFYADWDDLIISLLKRVIDDLKQECKTRNLEEIVWGKLNKSNIRHPLSIGIPLVDKLINMPQHQSSGCDFTINVSQPSIGVSVRFVVSPGREADAVWNMPCGQSGYPFSSHYRDLHKHWVKGLALPFLA